MQKIFLMLITRRGYGADYHGRHEASGDTGGCGDARKKFQRTGCNKTACQKSLSGILRSDGYVPKPEFPFGHWLFCQKAEGWYVASAREAMEEG